MESQFQSRPYPLSSGHHLSATCHRRRKSSLTILMLLLLIVANTIGSAQSATFFYGASRADGGAGDTDSTPNGSNGPMTAQLRVAEGTGGKEELLARGEGGNLNRDDLRSVYDFCIFLPVLERAGRVQKSAQSREICGKLVELLQPMFKRLRHAERDVGLLEEYGRRVGRNGNNERGP